MLCLVALITGCTPPKKPISNQSTKDTVTAIIPEAEQLKAIGNINFFISEKAFNIEKDTFLKSSHNPESDEQYSVSLPYKLGKYEFLRLDSHFNNDSLFYVSLIGFVYRDNFTPDFKNQYDALYTILSTKYGNPTEKAELPTEVSLITDKEVICALWELGNKNIIIKSSYENGSYFINLEVFRMDIINKIKDKINIDSKEAVNNDIDKI